MIAMTILNRLIKIIFQKILESQNNKKLFYKSCPKNKIIKDNSEKINALKLKSLGTKANN